MKAYGRTDVGRVRANNQDAFVIGHLDSDALYAVVCDGMGGANGGHVASAIAVRVLSNRLAEFYTGGMNTNSIRHMLESAISAANVDIFDEAMADHDLRGMGTTVVAALVVGRRLHIAHVGDSRAYLYTPDKLEQITRDHSIVQAMVEKGKLTQAEARTHPRKHFITRALGVDEAVECDFLEMNLEDDKRLLICTDGLTNMVEADDIYSIIKTNDPAAAPDQLIHAANMAGGSDNITAVLIV